MARNVVYVTNPDAEVRERDMWLRRWRDGRNRERGIINTMGVPPFEEFVLIPKGKQEKEKA